MSDKQVYKIEILVGDKVIGRATSIPGNYLESSVEIGRMVPHMVLKGEKYHTADNVKKENRKDIIYAINSY